MAGERSVDVAAASGTLHVALLGGFSVRVGSRAVPGSWRLRKSKTLVKLLALAGGHRAHRDVLAGVLWPGLDPAAAANNLHQVLHAARRALASDRSPSADALCLRDDIVILWPDDDLIVDADVFAAAAQRDSRRACGADPVHLNPDAAAVSQLAPSADTKGRCVQEAQRARPWPPDRVVRHMWWRQFGRLRDLPWSWQVLARLRFRPSRLAVLQAIHAEQHRRRIQAQTRCPRLSDDLEVLGKTQDRKSRGLPVHGGTPHARRITRTGRTPGTRTLGNTPASLKVIGQ